MNIVSKILFQLAEIKASLDKNLEEGAITYNYLICEDSCLLLDNFALEEYLMHTDIKNLFFLREVNKRCNDIITLWNEDFEPLPYKKLDEPFVCANEEKGVYHSSTIAFHTIKIFDDKWSYLRKDYFINNYRYKIYTIANIAQRCATILNLVTAAFPETQDFDLLPTQRNRNYWAEETENNGLISHYETILDNLIVKFEQQEDIGCYMYRFKMLPRYILIENKFTEIDKKYILKKLYNIYSELPDKPVFNELLNEFLEIIRPASDIYNYVVSQPLEVKPIFKNPLADIWLPEAKITVDSLITKGNVGGLWDENNAIITKRGSIYGTGKILLGSLSVALRGYAINSSTDFKIVGSAFCKAFNVKVNENTKDPYKSFQVGNEKYIKELKRHFNIG